MDIRVKPEYDKVAVPLRAERGNPIKQEIHYGNISPFASLSRDDKEREFSRDNIKRVQRR
ncbi:MAG: hypothetical protein PHE89_03660 [Alphaproteobacteria bacterium]|nr:hypothetical protein [Alphaproteobacteria bacterium]